MTLIVSSPIPINPATLFQLALLTLLTLHQGDSVPTPTERPRVVSDVIADIPPHGHAPWLYRLMHHTPIDPADGHRPLPWLTPSLTREEGIVSWTSASNVRSIRTA